MLNWLYLFRSRGGLSRSEVCGEMRDLKEYTVVSKHVKLLLENVQKPSCTPLGNPAEAETRRGNFDIKLRLSEKRQEFSSFMERRKSSTIETAALLIY